MLYSSGKGSLSAIGEPLRTRPVSDAYLARTWLVHCKESHGDCMAPSQSFMPTRLLDLNGTTEALSDVRLVDTVGMEPVEYVALSHCWGPPNIQPLRTTKALLPVYLNAISFQSLSLSFQDTVTFTRELGYQYLWIDSLCIVQDDHDD
jgi:hypothetical protein